MQTQPIPISVPINRAGVAVVDGFGIELRVHRGHLVVRDGIGPTRREARFARANSGLRRLVLIGHTGYVSLDALRWLTDTGVAFLQLDPDGRVLVASAGLGLDEPGLRRAQARAYGSETGMAIARDLLRRKLAGQRAIAGELGADDAVVQIDRAAGALIDATTPAELLVPEAAAAAATWSAWAPVELRWARQDQAKIPAYWRTFAARSSPLTSSPRTAINPANALLNYSYHLLEAAARLACLAAGLDPGLGVLHADLRARDSLALDVMEAVRPEVDRFVLDLLRTRTWRWADVVETRTGACRLLAPLTHELVGTLPTWESRLGPIVEGVARALAASAASSVRKVPTRLTHANRSAGRAGSWRHERPAPARVPTLGRRCKTCGDPVDSVRTICDRCRPEQVAGQRSAFLAKGTATLATLRATGVTPSNAPEAQASRARRTAANRAAATAWDHAHPEPADPEAFRRDVLPQLSGLRPAQLAQGTGLSRPYCAAILKGERVPHPSRWPELRAIARTGPQASGD